MVDSWEELRTKNRKRIPQLIILCVILFISAIFIINNFDFFTKKQKTETDDLTQERINDSAASRGDTVGTIEKENFLRSNVIDSIISVEGHKEKSIKTGDTLMKSVELQGIKCVLADKDSLPIQLSLKLSFKDENLKQEILFKRDDLIEIIKKIMKMKKLSDIVITTLRIECKSELNKLLKNGKIDDVEFIDFRPLDSL